MQGPVAILQDTGTAIIHGEKGQQVWTGFEDEEPLAKGVYNTYTTDNLRYSQNAPLNMYDEVNTRCNLPAQIDIEATHGMEYKFLCVVKGGGSVLSSPSWNIGAYLNSGFAIVFGFIFSFYIIILICSYLHPVILSIKP